jgi:hypothetical protein
MKRVAIQSRSSESLRKSRRESVRQERSREGCFGVGRGKSDV